MKDDNLVRSGFGLRKHVAGDLSRDYASDLMDRARERGFELSWPGLSFRIAKEFGFCYGVERAVDYAYEARLKFPDRRLYITGEIIHNPRVNQRLREMGYEFLDGAHGSTATPDALSPDDVVLIPAFGVTTAMMERLRGVGCVLVDTTCGSVLNVWKNVERYAQEGRTCLIHGKYIHEETRATASRALMYPGGRYVIVLDMAEADLVCDAIEGRLGREAFLAHFDKAVSPGFDPDKDLQRIGMANQTTMMSSESLAIAGRVGQAMLRRWGRDEVRERFRSFDTICSATQERQDAVLEMMRDPPRLMIIIGGFNSSNTGHLAEICAQKTRTYHIESAENLLDARRLVHQPVGTKSPAEAVDWLPEGELTVGVTAGASTPDREVGRVIARILELRGVDRAGAQEG